MKRFILYILSCLCICGCETKYAENPIALTQCANAPIARASATAFVLDNKAYVFGGRMQYDHTYPIDFYRYDPISDTWERLENLPFEGRSNMVAIVNNGVAYCGGGFAGIPQDTNAYKKDWWKYDGKQWTRLPDIPTDYTNGLIAFCIQDTIYVGYGSNFATSPELYTYNTTTNKWSDNILTHIPQQSGAYNIFTQNDDHIFSSLDFDNHHNCWSEYIPTDKTWKKRAAIPCKNACFVAATATSNCVFIAGGRTFGGSLTIGYIYDNIWAYDIKSDSWSLSGHLPQQSENMIAFTINDIAYFGLGENADGKRLNNLYKLNR